MKLGEYLEGHREPEQSSGPYGRTRGVRLSSQGLRAAVWGLRAAFGVRFFGVRVLNGGRMLPILPVR